VIQTELFKRLGSEIPVIQTAMGWVATPQLVAASTQAGAFGFLALATSSKEEAIASIDETLRLTDKPFGVNLHMFQPGAAEIIDYVIKHQIRAISYSRSPVPEYISKLKDAGVLCIPTVGEVKHAIKAESLGADALVIQGSEGGGHTGETPTSLLLSEVLKSVKIPVVAAGGFRDGFGLAAAIAWGASGIAMGTRFMMTQESPVPDSTKEAYLSCNTSEIRVTKKFDGLPHRLIFNKYIASLDKASSPRIFLQALVSGWRYKQLSQASFKDIFKAFFGMLKGDKLTIAQTMMAANSPVIIQKAMVEGKPNRGAMPSGQVAGLIVDLPTCGDLIEQIKNEFFIASKNFKEILDES